MVIERETGSYNDRRFSKPWIAKVTFESAEAKFEFGKWVGSPGESGILVIDLEPGDIYARGQKDFRKPRNSIPTYHVLNENGKSCMGELTKAQAYKYWREKNGD